MKIVTLYLKVTYRLYNRRDPLYSTWIKQLRDKNLRPESVTDINSPWIGSTV